MSSTTSYKDKKDPAIREQIVEGLLARAPWLAFEDTDPVQLQASDDSLDALLCALIARACTKRETVEPDDGVPASVEGWIHLPRCAGTLEALVQD